METDKAVNNNIKCKYNAGINCSSWTTGAPSTECEKCGWYGKNSEARLNAKSVYWDVNRKKWQKQLQPHKVRREDDSDEKP